MHKSYQTLAAMAAILGADNTYSSLYDPPLYRGKKKEPQPEEAKQAALNAAQAKRDRRAQKHLDLLKKAEEKNVEQQELKALLLNLSND